MQVCEKKKENPKENRFDTTKHTFFDTYLVDSYGAYCKW